MHLTQLQSKHSVFQVPKLPSILSAGDLVTATKFPLFAGYNIYSSLSLPFSLYLFLFFETVSADITIVGFFSFVKVFVDTRIKSSEI